MRIPASKRITVVLTFVCCGLFWNYGWIVIRVTCASGQTKIFEEMETRALKSDAKEAAEYLEYVTHYYVSGTRQEKGSRIDVMVERDRRRVIKEIIAYLRVKTGQDLGDDPQAWIRSFLGR